LRKEGRFCYDAEELREEINIELELIESTLRELSALQKDVAMREPTVREKTAAAFLAQFYGGIENYNTPQKLDKVIRCMLACHTKKEVRYGTKHAEGPRWGL
jgi:DNA gyrase/topoisomerase IV subunit B